MRKSMELIKKVKSKTRSCLLLIVLISFLTSPVYLLVQQMAYADVPRYGGTMVIAIEFEPNYLSMALGTSVTNIVPTVNMFNSLVDYNKAGDPIPDLAESWDISDDGLTYTFHLAKGVKWHDGEDFSSADVKYTYETILEISPGKGTLGVIKTIETPDKDTVVFQLDNPSAPLMSFIGKYWGCILPKHLYEGTDPFTNEYNTHPVGTGPFKFVEWIPGERVVLEKNDDYFKPGLPYLDRLVYKLIPSTTTQIAAMEAGEVDFMMRFRTWSDWDRITSLEDVTGVLIEPYAGNTVTCAYYNLNHPILGDKMVRQAISYAVDRELMVKLVSYGMGEAATGPVSRTGPSSWVYNPDVVKYPYDVDKANQLLDEAGYSRGADGIRFEITINLVTSTDYIKLSEIIRDNLKDVGITLELQAMEMATLMQKVFMNHDFDMVIMNSGDGPDPAKLGQHYHSDSIRPGFLLNVMSYSNERVDELLDLGLETIEQEGRAEIYKEIQEIMVEEQPALWLVESPKGMVHRSEIHGFPVGRWWFWDSLETLWSESGKTAAEIDIAKTVGSLQSEMGELTSELQSLSSGLEASSEGLSKSIDIVSDSIDTMTDFVGSVRDDLKADIAESNETIVTLQRNIGTSQTLMYAALVLLLVSIALPFVRK